jgi:hypothetical protein
MIRDILKILSTQHRKLLLRELAIVLLLILILVTILWTIGCFTQQPL